MLYKYNQVLGYINIYNILGYNIYYIITKKVVFNLKPLLLAVLNVKHVTLPYNGEIVIDNNELKRINFNELETVLLRQTR